jgi:membrane protease YdiL (CAAX protease family)
LALRVARFSSALVAMPPPATSAVLAVEFALLIGGLVLLWRQALSSAARGRPALLPAWDVSLSDFFLFLWLVIIGGVAGQFGLSLFLKHHPLDKPHLAIIGTAAFHGGMLLGMAAYRFFFSRSKPHLTPAVLRALNSGVATFLIALPVITAVSLLWQGLLYLCHITPENQEAIDLLRDTDSPTLRFLLLVVAIMLAPITEELIFRAGIFRYVRTRLPRWAALLLPAVLFAALHANLGSFVPLVALAVVFSLAFERTGNIGTTIVAHALFNLNASVLVLAGMNT